MSDSEMPTWKTCLLLLSPAILVLASRFSAVLFVGELNVDESQLMAQALRYANDMTPWRSVDGTTSGPLNSWIMLWLHAAGMPLSYGSAHLIAAVMLAMSCALVSLGILRGLGAWAALVGGMAFSIPLALAQSSDHVHFSTELLPLLMLSSAFVCVVEGLLAADRVMFWWSIAALLLGAAPWAKLQVLPISCLQMVWILHGIWQRRIGWMSLLVLMLAFSAASILMLSWLWSSGCLADFRISYLERTLSSNQVVALRLPLPLRVFRLLFSFEGSHAGPLALGCTVFVMAWLWKRRPGWETTPRVKQFICGFLWLWAAAAVASVLKPQTSFPHYEMLLFLPFGAAAGALASVWRDGTAKALLLAGVLLVPLSHAGSALIIFYKRLESRQQVDKSARRHVAVRLKELAPLGGRLAVWGWAPCLNVDTGMMPGTRHAICHFVIDPHPLREHFRQTYMEDLRARPPEVFVDAVTPVFFMWKWDKSARVESFPELAAFLKKHYELREEMRLDGVEEPVRIYLCRGAMP